MQKVKLKHMLLILVLAIVTLVVTSSIMLPAKPFNTNYSTVVFDRNGILLGAQIASDEQWRFSPDSIVPEKFVKALLAYEDQYFYYHPGINIVSIVNSLYDNIKARHIVRGGSTISMQVIRMSRERKGQSVSQKLFEMFLTMGLETRYSKNEILSIYASNAPMGGNVVGIKAASWRYFGHADHQLSWAEAATLAVLPNAPGLIHPGKNHDKLLKKRNELLKILFNKSVIDSVHYQLALLEKIPKKPLAIPQVAPHFVEYICHNYPSKETVTTIDYKIQSNINDIASWHTPRLTGKGVNNAVIVVADPSNNQVLAYVGNLQSNSNVKVANRYNDMVLAKRSTGSILKPFLYAAMNKDGLILPNTLVADIPSYFNDYQPKNYNSDYQGSVPASQALSRSLNVPAVYMLQRYGVTRFLKLLKSIGINSFNKGSNYYGLTLILGGGEASLFEITGAYCGMANTLIRYSQNNSKTNAFSGLQVLLDNVPVGNNIESPLNPASIWLTYQALKKVARPDSEIGWENFSSSKKIAWKTGTSHGFKDAWAVGTSANYVVGVWAGNANGEGVAGLSGTITAAPLMFDVFNSLDTNDDFIKPYGDLKKVEVCVKSGMLASRYCPDKVEIEVNKTGRYSSVCPYHKLIFTDSLQNYRLSQKCASVYNLYPAIWFVLPPIQEYYYSKKHPSYKPLPPFADGCESTDIESIQIVYPVNNTTIYVVVDESGAKKDVVFEAKNNNSNSLLYWHIDNKMVGVTKGYHHLALIPEKGKHILTLVNENGDSASVNFEVVN